MGKPRRRVAKARQPESFAECRERAVKLLSLRARSRRELERALEMRGFSEENVRRTIENAAGAGLLNEEAALEGFVATRGARYGRERLRRELEHRGFPAESVRRALASLSREDELRKLERLLRRREAELAGLEPERRRRRVFDFLRRRGFSAEQILELLG